MLAARENRVTDKVLNFILVLRQVWRTGRVLEDGKYPYEGELGQRRKERLVKTYEEYVAPILTVVLYVLFLYLIKLVRYVISEARTRISAVLLG